MSKYKAGDKIVLTISDVNEKVYYPYYEFNNNINLWEESIDDYAEPLTTYTEPLEDKIKKLMEENIRLIAENTKLKAKDDVLKTSCDDYEEKVNDMCDTARAEGQDEAWELARKIACRIGYDFYKIKEIFGTTLITVCFENNTYPEAAAKVAEWEKAKEEIKVGDVFQDDDGNNAIVTSIKGNTIYYMWDDGDTRSGFAEDVKKHFTKTGRHIDIDGFLKQIGEE